MLALGVNIDHVATLRQARLTTYPSPVEAAMVCERAGANGITLHLREDRRHIQDSDVFALRKKVTTKINLEIAVTPAMLKIATCVKPEDCCLVPEKRAELTTEGGLDVIANKTKIKEACLWLTNENIRTSLFIDADKRQIEAAKECQAPVIELHTGHYANATSDKKRALELNKIKEAAIFANKLGLQVNAGHGLTIYNTIAIASIALIYELNIGHAIIARAIFIGLAAAVQEMKNIMLKARL